MSENVQYFFTCVGIVSCIASGVAIISIICCWKQKIDSEISNLRCWKDIFQSDREEVWKRIRLFEEKWRNQKNG